MSFRKLLCPIDFSTESGYALQVAARLAIRSHAELVLVHVWHAGESSSAEQRGASIEQIVEDEQDSLDGAVLDAKELGVASVTSNLILGYPDHELVEMLRDDLVFDLVVMGTRGKTGLARVLGSVTDAVLRHAPCAVLVTRARTEVARFRNVLCPVDFSDCSRKALELATDIIEPDGKITLLHVEEPDDRALRARLLEEWSANLERTARVPVMHQTRAGSPAFAILAHLEENPAFDLVVMGSHGRTGMQRVLLGSVAETIVRRANYPVLVARGRGMQ